MSLVAVILAGTIDSVLFIGTVVWIGITIGKRRKARGGTAAKSSSKAARRKMTARKQR